MCVIRCRHTAHYHYCYVRHGGESELALKTPVALTNITTVCKIQTVDGFRANIYTYTCSLLDHITSICDINKNSKFLSTQLTSLKRSTQDFYKLVTCFGPIRPFSSQLRVLSVINSVKWLDDKESERTYRGVAVTLFMVSSGI